MCSRVTALPANRPGVETGSLPWMQRRDSLRQAPCQGQSFFCISSSFDCGEDLELPDIVQRAQLRYQWSAMLLWLRQALPLHASCITAMSQTASCNTAANISKETSKLRPRDFRHRAQAAAKEVDIRKRTFLLIPSCSIKRAPLSFLRQSGKLLQQGAQSNVYASLQMYDFRIVAIRSLSCDIIIDDRGHGTARSSKIKENQALFMEAVMTCRPLLFLWANRVVNPSSVYRSFQRLSTTHWCECLRGCAGYPFILHALTSLRLSSGSSGDRRRIRQYRSKPT